MKRLFPLITVLIFLSLLGIIFFQVLWIRQSLEARQQQFEESVELATAAAGAELVEENRLNLQHMILPDKGNLLIANPFLKDHNFLRSVVFLR